MEMEVDKMAMRRNEDGGDENGDGGGQNENEDG